MGATEEQMALLTTYNITHVAYILVLYSFAFLLYLFVNILLHIYAVCSKPAVPPKDVEYQGTAGDRLGEGGIRRLPGHRHTDSRQIRDAEEFELGALLSEDEDARAVESERPSTVGKNNETRV